MKNKPLVDFNVEEDEDDGNDEFFSYLVAQPDKDASLLVPMQNNGPNDLDMDEIIVARYSF